MESYLIINNKRILLPGITVHSFLNFNLVHTPLTWTIDVFNPEERETEYDYTTIIFDNIEFPGVTGQQDLVGISFSILEPKLNTCNNIIYVNGYEGRAKELSLSFTEVQGHILITGRGYIATGSEHLPFEFQSTAIFEKTRVFQVYDAEERILQINCRRTLSIFLEQLSSREYQQHYKNAAPFVHIPTEMIAQWDSLYLTNTKWFLRGFTMDELLALKLLEQLIRELLIQFDGVIPDIPDVFAFDIWDKIIIQAKTTLSLMQSV